MAHFYARISFITGIVLGVLLAVFFKNYVISKSDFVIKNASDRKVSLYKRWFDKQRITRKSVPWDELRYFNQTFQTESRYLFSKVKVLCIILVQTPKNLVAANETWAKGCTSIKPVFLESRNKVMPMKRTKESSSWVLLCNALNEANISLFDWVFVVKDSSFVIMENFRYYVAPLNAHKWHYLGHAVKFWSTIYNSADAGYALSRGALKVFQKKIGRNRCMENNYRNREDFYLGQYLATLNITPSNTVDDEGLSTFHPYSWYHVFYPGENYYKTSVFPVKCCSARSISFEATEGDKMYTFNYLFYKLQIFVDGGNKGNVPNRNVINDDKVWKQFLKERNVQDDNVSSEQYYKLWEDLINDPTSFAQNMKKEQLFDYE